MRRRGCADARLRGGGRPGRGHEDRGPGGIAVRGQAGRRDQQRGRGPLHQPASGARARRAHPAQAGEHPRPDPGADRAGRAVPARARGQRRGAGRGRPLPRARGDGQERRGAGTFRRDRARLPVTAARRHGRRLCRRRRAGVARHRVRPRPGARRGQDHRRRAHAGGDQPQAGRRQHRRTRRPRAGGVQPGPGAVPVSRPGGGGAPADHPPRRRGDPLPDRHARTGGVGQRRRHRLRPAGCAARQREGRTGAAGVAAAPQRRSAGLRAGHWRGRLHRRPLRRRRGPRDRDRHHPRGTPPPGGSPRG